MQRAGHSSDKIPSPRDLEADLLLTAAARLQAIRDGWSEHQIDLNPALLYNRKLWSVFVTSATSSENPLPIAIRQNVANLGLFVFKQTLAVMADPKPDRLGALINLNREIAAGLLGHA
jgi:flagellar protein FlaF